MQCYSKSAADSQSHFAFKSDLIPVSLVLVCLPALCIIRFNTELHPKLATLYKADSSQQLLQSAPKVDMAPIYLKPHPETENGVVEANGGGGGGGGVPRRKYSSVDGITRSQQQIRCVALVQLKGGS